MLPPGGAKSGAVIVGTKKTGYLIPSSCDMNICAWSSIHGRTVKEMTTNVDTRRLTDGLEDEST
jgi:hypothetical protein